jgi:hypothetical protein
MSYPGSLEGLTAAVISLSFSLSITVYTIAVLLHHAGTKEDRKYSTYWG